MCARYSDRFYSMLLGVCRVSPWSVGLIRPLFLSALQSHQRLPYPVPHSPAPDVPSPQTQSCLIILRTECVCVWSFVLAGWRLNSFFPKRGTSLFLIQRQNGGTSSGDMIFDGIFRGTSVKCSVSEGGGKIV